MVQRFPRGFKSGLIWGIAALIVGLILALFQWGEFLQSGRVVTSWSSRDGAS